MEPLPTTFELGQYRYRQLERHGDIALFEQRHKEADVTRFEVVRVRIARETTWPHGRVTPEREAYPGATSWGKDGFTAFSLAEAQAIAVQLQTSTATLPEAQETDEGGFDGHTAVCRLIYP